MISVLLKAGADLKARDEDGLTSLMWASGHNENPEVISVLLKAGADLKARDEGGLRSLLWAAGHNKKPRRHVGAAESRWLDFADVGSDV